MRHWLSYENCIWLKYVLAVESVGVLSRLGEAPKSNRKFPWKQRVRVKAVLEGWLVVIHTYRKWACSLQERGCANKWHPSVLSLCFNELSQQRRRAGGFKWQMFKAAKLWRYRENEHLRWTPRLLLNLIVKCLWRVVIFWVNRGLNPVLCMQCVTDK